MNFGDLNNRLPKKRAFITGAASGLGASFSKLLSTNGWTLHLADIQYDELHKLKEELPEKDLVHLYELDITDKETFAKTGQLVSQQTDGIDLVINNAGIGDGELIENYQLEAWERMININLMGTYYGVHYFLPALSKEGGLIINIGSAAGFMNAPGMSAYNASKAAVYSFSETLYHELKSKNIHVSVVTPSFFKTNIMSNATGSQRFVDFAEKQMKYSKTNADEMAAVILSQAAAGKFQILFPKEARRNYFIKKWFPGLIEKEFQKLVKKFSS